MSAFRNKKFTILVATDIAARGLDVPHIEHVINYDLPQVAEDYIHRMGRTARAGAEGSSLSFITNSDREKWNAIERLLDPTKKKENFSKEKSGGGFQRDYKNKKRGGGGFKSKSKFRGGRSSEKFGRNKFSENFKSHKPEGFKEQKSSGFKEHKSPDFKEHKSSGFKDRKPAEGFKSGGFDKDYRRKSDREKPKFFGKKSKGFKDRNFNARDRKKNKNRESFN
jgi:superfamily II DNA/RNA helicase